jgi:hypothetical protein
VAVERNSTEEAFRVRYDRDSPEQARAARKLIQWARDRGLRLRPRAGETHDTLMCLLNLGANEYKIFSLETNGHVWVLFSELTRRFPSTDAEEKAAFLATFREKLEKVPGGRAAPGSRGGKASWALEATDLPAFLAVLEWSIEELRRHQGELLSSSRRRSR